MTTHKNFLSKINLILIAGILLFSTLLPLIISKKVNAAPTVTITSPTSNQQIPGTNFTVTGTATPNTTIVVSTSGNSIGQTISDSNGKWSINSSLPAGNINL
ncbi:MAG: Bacterial Ig domain, partial [Patescibacteria group bacterium]|nr:Bacterial Ig domain [Patescibacteria group bacterium]